ncbi:hypothetical protein BGX26_002985 [Mortierella sp. AD094]|nr:hypothetical protein BGX26_002985 [Mortierella sp. AD094]
MVEDIKAAATYLSILDNVDPTRIGVLSVCAGGGYALAATSMDPRIRALAAVSAVNLGGYIRSLPKDTPHVIMAQAGEAHIDYARTCAVKYLPFMPAQSEVAKDTPTLEVEESEYYLTPRGQYKTSVNRAAIWSYDILAQHNSFAFLDWISSRPILLVAGSKADTLFFIEDAYKAS